MSFRTKGTTPHVSPRLPLGLVGGKKRTRPNHGQQQRGRRKPVSSVNTSTHSILRPNLVTEVLQAETRGETQPGRYFDRFVGNPLNKDDRLWNPLSAV